MTDHSSLLAAILATADNDVSHHAVYADALQAAGDPRGELIALELALAVSSENPGLVARRAELRAEYGALWWPGIPNHHVRTRHGFVDAVAIPADQIDLAVELASREPLRSLELCGTVPLDVLVRVPPVRELVAHGLNDAGLRALYAAPCAATLVSLDIAGSDVREFCPGASLPACRRLSLAATSVDAFDGDAWLHAHTLRELDISLPIDGRIDTHRVLTATRNLTRLSASCVEDFATPATCAALAQLRSLVRLELFGHQEPVDALRGALPSTTELATTLPDRVTVDLLADQLVFDVAGHAHRNGARVPLRIRYTQSDSIASSTRGTLDDAEPTSLLVAALACGGPRLLTAQGCTIAASLLPRDNRITAELRLQPSCVELDLEHYVD